MPVKFRLIIDNPMPAGFNMAADEYLMESQKDSQALPTLRLYRWQGEAISIGYFQSVDAVRRLYATDKKGITVIRRVSGGGLVEHGRDLTLSLTMKNPSLFFPVDTKESYLKVHEVLRKAMKPLYPELDYARCDEVPSPRGKGNRICFDEPTCHDLLLRGKKVVGSSQRRRDGMLLHQSALFFGGDVEDTAKRIVKRFEVEWGVQFKVTPWTEAEKAQISKKEEERYRSPDWIS